ncbi:hypothetical protein LZ31DRAFT_360434 [Colletotrichum somersetense]|nr:hypothetical protein LZ31DRAFT_360434 [Colletotrichum somersetense]
MSIMGVFTCGAVGRRLYIPSGYLWAGKQSLGRRTSSTCDDRVRRCSSHLRGWPNTIWEYFYLMLQVWIGLAHQFMLVLVSEERGK